MKTITISDRDVLELGLLRDRLERERLDSHREEGWTTSRTNDRDREVEVINRALKQVSK